VWVIGAAFVAGAIVAGIAVDVIVTPGGTTKPNPKSTPIAAGGIDMSKAIGVVCGPPAAPGPGHPDPLLSQLFNVQDPTRSSYLLGWQIVPFHGAGRSYRFGTGGNLLALEPPTGGDPVGFGKGTVTFGHNADSGAVNAVVTLTAGGKIAIGGTWTCVVPSSTPTTTTTAPPPIS
jgi:hypothetical protein